LEPRSHPNHYSPDDPNIILGSWIFDPDDLLHQGDISVDDIAGQIERTVGPEIAGHPGKLAGAMASLAVEQCTLTTEQARLHIELSTDSRSQRKAGMALLQETTEQSRAKVARVLSMAHNDLDNESAAPEVLLVASARNMGTLAHSGERRATGRPYIKHPEESAAVGHFIFSALRDEPEYEINAATEAVALAVWWVHDGPEHTNQFSRWANSRQNPNRVTPLDFRTLMAQTDSTYLDVGVQTLKLMTHNKDIPWEQKYPRYVARGAGGVMFPYIKTTDHLTNDLEPKPEPDMAVDTPTGLLVPAPAARRPDVRQEEDEDQLVDPSAASVDKYARTRDSLAGIAIARAFIDGARPWTRDYFEIQRTVTADQLPDLVDAMHRAWSQNAIAA
jgi:hypothetical protein